MNTPPGPPSDPLLALAQRLAAGEPVDAALPGIEADRARGMRRLAGIVQRLRPQGDAGQTWGHLQRLQLAGSGAYGEVYRAYDPTLDRMVALKLRRIDAPAAIFSGRDFVAEAQRLARVRHPNVLAVHGAGYHDGRAGLWTDWIEGETLRLRLVRDGVLPFPLLLQLAIDLASALAAVHAAGLVHGDVKPENVMLDLHGHALLTDFGAGFDSADHAGALATGTPGYLAPEVVRGESAGPAMDMYALGVLLRRAGGDAAPRGPRALQRLVRRLLAGPPAARPDADAALAALLDVRAAPLRRARRIALAAIVAGLAAIAFVSWQAYRRADHLRLETQAALARSESANRFLVDLLSSAAADALGPRATLRDLLDHAPALIAQRFADRPADRMRLLELLAGIEADFAHDDAAARLAALAAVAAAEADPAGDDVLRLQALALRWRATAGIAPDAAAVEANTLLQRAERERRDPAILAALEFQLAEIELRVSLLRATPALTGRIVERVQRVLAAPVALDARVQADALRRLAVLRLESGHAEDAAVLAARAVAHAEAAFGREHPLAALNRRVLAWTLMEGEQPVRAETLFRTNLALHEAKLGRRSRPVADDLVGLVWALANQSRHAEALTLAQEAWTLTGALYGEGHRTTIDAGLGLAHALAENERDGDAAELLSSLRMQLRALRGQENRQYLLATRQLALLWQGSQPEAARELFAECAETGLRTLGADSQLARSCAQAH